MTCGSSSINSITITVDTSRRNSNSIGTDTDNTLHRYAISSHTLPGTTLCCEELSIRMIGMQ